MYYIGIDLGGTNIAVGLVDENANILHSDSVPRSRSGTGVRASVTWPSCPKK